MPRLRPSLALLPFALTLLACDKPEEESVPTMDEVRATCEAQTTPDACAAVPVADYPEIGESAWCTWIVGIPVVHEGDVCSFGAATGSCQLETAGDPGCYAPTASTCGPGEYQWSWTEDGMTVLSFANEMCSPRGTPCNVTPDGVVEGPPECACLCAPDLPLD